MTYFHTQPWALYNEIDDHAADWLENLIARGMVAPGIVDRRSIEDICSDDLRGFRQVHFFAGIGIWSYSLRCIGITDDVALWSGSCPCQPFSAAGKGGGVDDERHLRPALFHLIRECRPGLFFGEQVASKDGLGWLDSVLTDLEKADYAAGPLDTCSAGSGAPHIRQRLRIAAYDLRSATSGVEYSARDGWFERRAEPSERSLIGGRGPGRMAHCELPSSTRFGSNGRSRQASCRLRNGFADSGELSGMGLSSSTGSQGQSNWFEDVLGSSWTPFERTGCESTGSVAPGSSCGMAEPTDLRCELGERGDSNSAGCETEGRGELAWDREQSSSDAGGTVGMGNSDSDRTWRQRRSLCRPVDRNDRQLHSDNACTSDSNDRPRPTNGFWRDADWLFCRDGKWRPIEPGTFPLVDGSAFRVGSGSPFEGKSRAGMLKGYGNAIDAEATADFLRAFFEIYWSHGEPDEPADAAGSPLVNSTECGLFEDLLG